MRSLIKVCGKGIRIEGKVIRIARLDADRYQFVEEPEAVLGGLRSCGTRVDLFTFMQKLPETAPKFRYPMELDNLAALPVSTFDHWWTKQVDAKTRNMVRKAEKKGVVVREVAFDDALVKGIWEIYNEVEVRQGRPNSHFGKNIKTVHDEEATFPESSVFIGAFLEDSLIGFAKLVRDETGTQVGMMNIVSMIRHRDKAPTNALVAHAVRCCAEWGVPYLVYAGFKYGKKQQDSLSDFKRNNGFQQIDLPRYYVALTLLGSLAFRLGLHHRLAHLLPESVAGKLRELRSVWYNRKLQSATEAR